jgi:murein DD-endopeptidase MepM/ murein hydrolase activator NlpD
MAGDGSAPSTWSLPVRGAITQPFGPTTFPLEPARTYNGVFYAHFHDAVDLAAPLGQPVLAAAEGRVTFVGHPSTRISTTRSPARRCVSGMRSREVR